MACSIHPINKNTKYVKEIFNTSRSYFERLEFNTICFIYIVSSWLLGNLNLAEILRAFLAAPNLIFAPYLLSKSVTQLLPRQVSDRLPILSDVVSVVVHWFAGMFELVLCIAILQLLHAYFILQNMHLVIVLVAAVAFGLNTALRRDSHKIKVLGLVSSFGGFVVLPVLMLVGFFPVVLAKIFVPFPDMGRNYTFGLIQQVVWRFMTEGFVQMDARLAEFSLIGVASSFLNISPLSLIWVASFVASFAFSTGIYLFSYSISHSKLLGFVASLFGVFLNVGPHPDTIFYETISYQFYSDTINFAVFPLALFVIHSLLSKRKNSSRDTTFTLFVVGSLVGSFIFVYFSSFMDRFSWNLRSYILLPVILLALAIALLAIGTRSSKMSLSLGGNHLSAHFWTEGFLVLCIISVVFVLFTSSGIAYTFFLWAYVAVHKLSNSHRGRRFLYGLIAVTALFAGLQFSGILRLPMVNPVVMFNPELAGPDYIRWEFTFEVKSRDFLHANGYPIIVLFVLGLLSSLYRKDRTELAVAAFTSLIFLFFVLPVGIFYRFYMQFTPLMAFYIAYAIYKIYGYVGKRHLGALFSATRLSSPISSKSFGVLCALLVLVSTHIGLTEAVYQRYSLSPTSLWTDYEYDAAQWTSGYFDFNVRIISDFRTMIFMNSMASRIQVVSGLIPPLLSNEEKIWLKTIKQGIFQASDSQSAYEAIQGFKDKASSQDKHYADAVNLQITRMQLLIVISCRTSEWIDQPSDGISEVTYPSYAAVNQSNLKIFNNSTFFKLIYNVGDKIFLYVVNSNV